MSAPSAYAEQAELPSLPIPALESTLLGSSRSLAAFGDNDAVSKLLALAGSQRDGHAAQKLLEQRAANCKTNPHTSWLYK